MSGALTGPQSATVTFGGSDGNEAAPRHVGDAAFFVLRTGALRPQDLAQD